MNPPLEHQTVTRGFSQGPSRIRLLRARFFSQVAPDNVPYIDFESRISSQSRSSCASNEPAGFPRFRINQRKLIRKTAFLCRQLFSRENPGGNTAPFPPRYWLPAPADNFSHLEECGAYGIIVIVYIVAICVDGTVGIDICSVITIVARRPQPPPTSCPFSHIPKERSLSQTKAP